MKTPKYFFVFLFFLISLNPLSADPRACSGNDTVVLTEQDANDLMSYLKGTWSVSGNWQITEGEGKIQKVVKTRILGVETFKPILNGHFLQKNLNAKIKYHSRDMDKIIQNPFSSMTILTFNANLNKYFYWFYDSSGSFIEAGGTFNRDQNQYVFLSRLVNENGKEVENMYKLTIVDDDHYRWEVQQRNKGEDMWQPGATGLSTRKRS